MKGFDSRVIKALLILVIAFVPAPGLVALGADINPLQEIQKSFPDSIHMGVDGERSIEFCPDNTCDLFVASKEMPIESLKDFAYLYIYFFSNYYSLDVWRKRQEPVWIASRILTKVAYQGCKRDSEEEMARCILRELGGKERIRLYFVRYDEKVRILERQDIFKATSVTRIRK